MTSRIRRRPMLWSPLLALAIQLALATAAAAVTGGADFPF